MKVGLFSPLPPAPTGVADYSAALQTQLEKHGLVESSPSACDIPLYHLGNNQLHRRIYEHALARPGVVVLHDALLQHFYLGSFRQKTYVKEFVFNYGSWAQEEAETLWDTRSLSAQDARFFERPMLKRIAQSALAVIVHNPAAARAVREHAPITPVYEVPHFADSHPAQSPDAVAKFRQQLNLTSAGFVFTIFGFLRESKRLVPILRAFLRLRRLRPDVRLLVAGEFISQDLERAAQHLLDQPGVVKLGHLSDTDLHTAAFTVDCCINLRYPTARETSGIAIRLMAAGKPVIVTEGEEWARIPETCLLRIPAGAAEGEALFHAMALLAERPDIGHKLGEQAAAHIQRYHSLSSSAAEYWKILCRTYASRPS